MNTFRFSLVAAVAALALAGRVLAADPVLVSAPGGLSATTADVIAEANRIPADIRSRVLAQPNDVAQMAQNVLFRRVLANEAEETQLDRDPQVAAQLRLARERVLAEARMARIEGQAADRGTLERLAAAEYRAKPEAYDTPEQIRVRHILLDARSCDAEKRIAQLRDQARNPGADFAALAREHSQDPGSAKRGGDLGLFARGRMAPEFDRAAFALTSPGDVSEVVRTEFGLHIIRLEERKAPERQPFEKVREVMIKEIEGRELRLRRSAAADAINSRLQFDRAAVEAFAKETH